MKYQHNDIILRLLAYFEGHTIEDQIATMTNFIDTLFQSRCPPCPSLMCLYSRTLNNPEMCKIIVKIAIKHSDMKILKDMLDGAIYNGNRDIYDAIISECPLLRFSISLERLCVFKTKINVEFLKYILDQRGGINQQEIQTMSKLLLDDGNIHLLEYVQNYQ